MSARELMEWRAYEYVTGTLGPERMDTLAAMLAQRITAMLGSGSKQPDVIDFVPNWDQGKAEQ